MEYNFLIVLFKNKTKKKIINKFKKHKVANEFFKNLIKKSNDVYFEKKYENGKKCDFELALLEKTSNTLMPIFMKDGFGRQVKVELEDSDYTITKIEAYKLEEDILDFQTKLKINFIEFISKYINSDGIKLISKLNNKIVVQNDDSFFMFTLKNLSDSERFLDNLQTFLVDNGKMDCILVKDTSTTQRKFLYEILVKKGFPKDYLMRHSTTHPE